jgi:para-nitrobenzyl esterase
MSARVELLSRRQVLRRGATGGLVAMAAGTVGWPAAMHGADGPLAAQGGKEGAMTDTIVQTHTGSLRGAADGDVLIFRGIPFAAPPVGPRRFRPPEPAVAWAGVRDATRFGPAAIQGANPFADIIPIAVPEPSEDCLTLNVFTPGTDGRRPVLVWIHGGGFLAGASSQPDWSGAELVRRGDVVVVTLNYRLGAFGFLHSRTLAGDALDATGNEGLLDQVAALRWVRDEIAAFGGDPDNVTVFGQSAGGISIAALLGMPAARGFVHKAILQSSGTAGQHLPAAVASRVMARLLELTGLTPSEAGKLRDVSPAELAQLQMAAAFPVPGYFPVIDGAVLPRSAYDAVRDGETAGIPLLIGTVADEDTLFETLDPTFPTMDEAGLRARAELLAPGRGEEAVALYRTERAARGEATTPPALWTAMVTDQLYQGGSMRLAELQARHTPAVYAYRFVWPSPLMGGALGTFHGLELPFLWGLDTAPALWPAIGDVTAARALSPVMQDAWLAFARTGDPNHAGLPVWPAYESGRRATMRLGRTPTVEDAPHDAEREFWEAVRRAGRVAATA